MSSVMTEVEFTVVNNILTIVIVKLQKTWRFRLMKYALFCTFPQYKQYLVCILFSIRSALSIWCSWVWANWPPRQNSLHPPSINSITIWFLTEEENKRDEDLEKLHFIIFPTPQVSLCLSLSLCMSLSIVLKRMGDKINKDWKGMRDGLSGPWDSLQCSSLIKGCLTIPQHYSNATTASILWCRAKAFISATSIFVFFHSQHTDKSISNQTIKLIQTRTKKITMKVVIGACVLS